MQWASWAEFWAMGGYALYVWGSFAVTLLFMAGEMTSLVLGERTARARNGDEA
jgi:heme exporter protein D